MTDEPKYAIVKLSEVRKGNGCMLPARFMALCHECDRVDRCTNVQAIAGRQERAMRRLTKALSDYEKAVKECLKATEDYERSMKDVPPVDSTE